jgi:hypothetical protein
MPCVGFDPTIPASERGKTVHVLDRSATVTGLRQFTNIYYQIKAMLSIADRHFKFEVGLLCQE